MAEIEVGFGAVVGDVHFAVLEGVHGAGIDVDVGVEFLEGDRQSPGFQQGADGGGGKPLAEGGEDAAGDEDVLGLAVGVRWSHATGPVCRGWRRVVQSHYL